MNNDENKEKFRIEHLSEATRKKIFVVSLSILMLAVITIWITSFSTAVKINEESDESLEIIKKQLEELGQVFEEGKETAEELKKQFEALPTTTTTTTSEIINANNEGAQISNESLKEIKNIILENTQEATE